MKHSDTNKTFLTANPGLFFFSFVFSKMQLTDKLIQNTLLAMLGFEPRISGFRSGRSANCTTSMAILI